MDNTIKLLGTVFPFLEALIWPVALVIILRYFGTSLKKFIEHINDENTSELSLKVGAVEANLKKQSGKAIEATSELFAAEVEKSESTNASKELLNKDKIAEIGYIVNDAVFSRKMADRLTGSSILWIDNKPTNNLNERRAFEALGANITVISDTSNLLQKLLLDKYNVVISSNGQNQSFNLLEEIQDHQINTSVIIYTPSNSSILMDEALKKGAYGVATSPLALFQFVTNAIEQQGLSNKTIARKMTETEMLPAIFKWLKARYPNSMVTTDKSVDFTIASPNGHKIGVEVKLLRPNMSRSYMARILKQTTGYFNEKSLDHLIIVFSYDNAEDAIKQIKMLNRSMTLHPNITLILGYVDTETNSSDEFFVVSSINEVSS